ncbi:chromatin assembly factor 1 subunit A-like [Bacillus rossius redtenbacheri]|uniref:chromatin assembly factor 1 subunit A-like n=1 Tax=Bacillus rossius redtenbacheri TaxID=93214 RepID=UPI002FDEFD08
MKTKKMTVEGHSACTVQVTPPAKKLKQARLPFQVLAASPAGSTPSPLCKLVKKKRKLSESSEDVKVKVKVMRSCTNKKRESKENVHDPAKPVECAGKLENKKKASATSPVARCSIEPKKCETETEDKTENLCDVICLSDSESDACVAEVPDERNVRSSSVSKRVSLRGPNNSPSSSKRQSSRKGNESKKKYLTPVAKPIGDSQTAEHDGNESTSKSAAGKVASRLESVASTVVENGKLLKKNTSTKSAAIKLYSAAVTGKLSQDDDDDNIVLSESSETESDESEDLDSEGEATAQKSPSEAEMHKSPVKEETCKSPVNGKTRKSSGREKAQKSSESSEKDSKIEKNDLSETHKTPLKKTPSPRVANMSKRTPRQVQKQLESEKKKEEKARQKQEREKRRAEEREEKRKQIEQKREQQRKEKEEKEEQKKKEREEKEKKRLAELELKNEERKAKEEERRTKEEERKAKEEERRKREEQKMQEKKLKEQAEEEVKRKKEKEAAAFTSFFVPKKSEPKQMEAQQNTRRSFRPFMVKNDMRLATVSRASLSGGNKHELERAIREQSCTELYLRELRSGKITSRRDVQTWPLKDLQDEVMIIDDDMGGMDRDNLVMESHPPVNIPHPKLLQFHENKRPPYWGTWTKKSTCVGPRRPFGKEENLFDYDVDSDDEWEEEEPGESLNGSEDEKESEDEYEVDNDFFVPHGYLSDEENFEEEEGGQSPETMKAKLKLLAIEFEEERMQKTQRLKPGLIGCIWTRGSTASTKVGEQMRQFLAAWRAVYQSNGPIELSVPDEEACPRSPNSEAKPPGNQSSAKRRRRVKFPESALPDLVKLIHGNKNSQNFLLREFLAHWLKQRSLETASNKCDEEVLPAPESAPVLSKKSILNKIKEIATWQQCPEEGTMHGQMCWYVSSETRSALGLSDLKVLNMWEYNLKRRRLADNGEKVNSPVSCAGAADSSHRSCPNSGQLITKFTKVLSEKERQKQLSPIAAKSERDTATKTKRKIIFPVADSPSSLPSSRKKVQLTSLPKSSHSLVKYLKSPKNSTASMKPENSPEVQSQSNEEAAAIGDCIIID